MGKSRVGNGFILAGVSGLVAGPFWLPAMIAGFVIGALFPIF